MIKLLALSIALRGGLSWQLVAPHFAGEDFVPRMQEVMETYSKTGLNLVWRLPKPWASAKALADTKAVMDHARRFGIRGLVIHSLQLRHRADCPKDLAGRRWPCVWLAKGWDDLYFCWSDDAATERAAEACAEYLHRIGCEDAVVMLHPVDTAGAKGADYEKFISERCERCRARWKDDERWKATAHQLNIWARILKARCPKAMVGSCCQPYTFSKLQKAESLRDDAFRRDMLEFWSRVDEAVEDPDFFFASWIYPKKVIPELKRLVKRHPVVQMDTFSDDAGVYSTTVRRAAAGCDRGERSVYMMYSDFQPFSWETYAISSHYLEHPEAPGAVAYDGTVYYDPFGDHTGPAEATGEVLDGIIGRFWGGELAADMKEYLLSGVLGKYIERPVELVRYWNRLRRDPQYDTEGGSTGGGVAHGFEPFVDSTEFMHSQYRAAKRAHEAIERVAANPAAAKLGPVMRRTLEFRRGTARKWYLAARAKSALRLFDDSLGKGDFAKAEKCLRQPHEGFEREFAEAGAALEFAKRPPDAAPVRVAEELGVESAPLSMKRKKGFDFVWSGEVVVDRPLEEDGKSVFVKPGTKIVFRGEGRVNLKNGAFFADGAEFTADSVLTNSYRICVSRGEMRLRGCTFRGVRATMASWGRAAIGAGMNSAASVEDCRFEDSSGVAFMNAHRCSFERNRVQGGDIGVAVYSVPAVRIAGNEFRNVSERPVYLGGAAGTVVAGNRFESAAKGGGAGLVGYGAGDSLRIVGNDFINIPRQMNFKGPQPRGTVFAGNVLRK